MMEEVLDFWNELALSDQLASNTVTYSLKWLGKSSLLSFQMIKLIKVVGTLKMITKGHFTLWPQVK